MPEVRLIDANALFNDLKESANAAREWREEAQDEETEIRAEQAHGTFVECALRVKNAPTIETEPVRHGRWIYADVLDYKDPNGVIHVHGMCSRCRLIYDFRNMTSRFRFCPNCGARMDGGADNG